MQRSWIWLAIVLGASWSSQSARADVLVVGPPWVGGAYTSIQPAVDAAHDGDVILVHTTESAAFTVDGKGVSVVEWPGHNILLTDTIVVRNLPEGAVVLLDGLAARGAMEYPGSHPGLLLQGNAGQIRAQGCDFTGGYGAYGVEYGGVGGEGVAIEDSPRVVLQSCAIRGGTGGEAFYWAGDGGPGVLSSGSALALYDCKVVGGEGGDAYPGYESHSGGDGGAGVHVTTWGVFLSGGFVWGGRGGDCNIAGNGGAGILLDAAQGRVLDVDVVGGVPGTGNVHGTYGPQYGGTGLFFLLPESSVQLTATALSSGHVTLQIVGQPGASVWLFLSRRVDQRFVESWTGIASFPANTWTTMQPVGTIPATGQLQLDVPIFAPNGSEGSMWIQALTRPPVGDPVLSSPRAVTTLAAPLPPG